MCGEFSESSMGTMKSQQWLPQGRCLVSGNDSQPHIKSPVSVHIAALAGMVSDR